jgi:hypothetical protein
MNQLRLGRRVALGRGQCLLVVCSATLALQVLILGDASSSVVVQGTFIGNSLAPTPTRRNGGLFHKIPVRGQCRVPDCQQSPPLSFSFTTTTSSRSAQQRHQHQQEESFHVNGINTRSERYIELENTAFQELKRKEDETHRINLQLAQLARDSQRNYKMAAHKAYDLLRTQAHPDTVGYNSVLKALAKTSSSTNKRAAATAEKLLQEMEELHQTQSAQRALWFQRQSELTEDEYAMGPPKVWVKPNVRSYSTVMDAYGKQSSYEGAVKAQTMLNRLQDKFTRTQDYAVMPNEIAYNTVLNAWAKSGSAEEGAERCEQVLHQMMDLGLADVISYNAAIHGWARSGVPDAGRHAERLLRTMSRNTNGNGLGIGDDDTNNVMMIQPNARTYTTTMDAWSRSHGCEDSSQRAHVLLKEMEALAAQGDVSMQPNYITYSTVINAYALSKSEPYKAHKAFALLQHMVRLSAKNNNNRQGRPNRVTYNAVLNACATSCPNLLKESSSTSTLLPEGLPSLASIVRTLYKQLLAQTGDETLGPDHYTFGTVLKAVANVFWGEPDQVEFAEQVFEEACRQGYVSFGVLVQLKQAAPVEVYRNLIPREAYNPENGHFYMKSIPKEWTRNVQEDNNKQLRQQQLQQKTTPPPTKQGGGGGGGGGGRSGFRSSSSRTIS